MNADNVLKYMKQRRRKLKARIKRERRDQERLKYKSRRLRMSSPIISRIEFFTDRLQELQICIDLIEDKISPRDFVINQNGDAADMVATGVGNSFKED